MTKPLRRNPLKPLSSLLLLCLGITVSSARPAYACSCMRPSAPNQALAEATAVFSGQVTNIEQVRLKLNVTFRVDEWWKGEPVQNIVVQTAATTAACGYPFEVGQTYLVYASHRQGRLQTNYCSRTALLSQAADDLSILSKALPCKGKYPAH